MARATNARAADLAETRGPGLRSEDPDALRHYYEQMLLLRRFEERAGEMYTRAKIGGYCHLNLGEEATIVGLMAALTPDDYIFTNYREHGYIIARGVEPGPVMAELFGKETGVARGRGGSMHLFDAGTHFMGGYGIVGGQIPLAVGAAYALDYQGRPGGPSTRAAAPPASAAGGSAGGACWRGGTPSAAGATARRGSASRRSSR